MKEAQYCDKCGRRIIEGEYKDKWGNIKMKRHRCRTRKAKIGVQCFIPSFWSVNKKARRDFRNSGIL